MRLRTRTWHRFGWASAGLVASGLAGLGLASCGGETVSDRPQRIIVISMDTVRADHVSGFGTATTTPALAEIAAQGVALPNFYAASSFTLPSHMSIFTGLDPMEHGVWREPAQLNPNVKTLAEVLAEAGYRTAAFHEGGYVSPRYGFDRGFETYLELPRMDVVGRSLDRVIDWIRAHRGEDYFLFVHTYAAHYPYGGFERYAQQGGVAGRLDPGQVETLRRRWDEAHARRSAGRAPDEVPDRVRARCTLYNQLAEHHGQLLGCGDNFVTRDNLDAQRGDLDLEAIRQSYDERIRGIDRAVARIRAVLEDQGEWDDTLLVVTSDHGEAFLEHGVAQHDYVPFDEVLRVPAVLSYPRLLRDGRVRELPAATWHLDLMPTILGFSGVPFPGRPRGLDLGPALRGEASLPPDRAVFPSVLGLAHRPPRPERRVAVQGDLKYVEGAGAFGDTDGLLFDLADDPGEMSNLREQRPGRFADLEGRVAAWRLHLEPQPALHRESGRLLPEDPLVTIPSVELSPDDREKLRELGYGD